MRIEDFENKDKETIISILKSDKGEYERKLKIWDWQYSANPQVGGFGQGWHNRVCRLYARRVEVQRCGPKRGLGLRSNLDAPQQGKGLRGTIRERVQQCSSHRPEFG